ncbi:hypothetical protein V5O48_008816 [Marasmius crinis-equi]|uniref:Uncharacterized protein n=1 Tax=Marasmius crinis-equi TaxID=585013 RepID=A0ABR3FCW6_9AGAR
MPRKKATTASLSIPDQNPASAPAQDQSSDKTAAPPDNGSPTNATPSSDNNQAIGSAPVLPRDPASGKAPTPEAEEAPGDGNNEKVQEKRGRGREQWPKGAKLLLLEGLEDVWRADPGCMYTQATNKFIDCWGYDLVPDQAPDPNATYVTPDINTFTGDAKVAEELRREKFREELKKKISNWARYHWGKKKKDGAGLSALMKSLLHMSVALPRRPQERQFYQSMYWEERLVEGWNTYWEGIKHRVGEPARVGKMNDYVRSRWDEETDEFKAQVRGELEEKYRKEQVEYESRLLWKDDADNYAKVWSKIDEIIPPLAEAVAQVFGSGCTILIVSATIPEGQSRKSMQDFDKEGYATVHSMCHKFATAVFPKEYVESRRVENVEKGEIGLAIEKTMIRSGPDGTIIPRDPDGAPGSETGPDPPPGTAPITHDVSAPDSSFPPLAHNGVGFAVPVPVPSALTNTPNGSNGQAQVEQYASPLAQFPLSQFPTTSNLEYHSNMSGLTLTKSDDNITLDNMEWGPWLASLDPSQRQAVGAAATYGMTAMPDTFDTMPYHFVPQGSGQLSSDAIMGENTFLQQIGVPAIDANSGIDPSSPPFLVQSQTQQMMYPALYTPNGPQLQRPNTPPPPSGSDERGGLNSLPPQRQRQSLSPQRPSPQRAALIALPNQTSDSIDKPVAVGKENGKTKGNRAATKRKTQSVPEEEQANGPALKRRRTNTPVPMKGRNSRANGQKRKPGFEVVVQPADFKGLVEGEPEVLDRSTRSGRVRRT